MYLQLSDVVKDPDAHSVHRLPSPNVEDARASSSVSVSCEIGAEAHGSDRTVETVVHPCLRDRPMMSTSPKGVLQPSQRRGFGGRDDDEDDDDDGDGGGGSLEREAGNLVLGQSKRRRTLR